MKKIVLTVALLLTIFCSNMYAQGTSSADMLTKDNASVALIKAIFEKAYYTIKETGATYVAVHDSIYDIYFDLDDKRYVTISTNYQTNDKASLQDKFDLLNTIGKDVLIITPYFSADQKILTVKTTVWLEGGMPITNLVAIEKIFVKACDLVITKDTKLVIK